MKNFWSRMSDIIIIKEDSKMKTKNKIVIIALCILATFFLAKQATGFIIDTCNKQAELFYYVDQLKPVEKINQCLK